MEINTRYHSDRDLERTLDLVDSAIKSRRETANRVNVVYTARKPVAYGLEPVPRGDRYHFEQIEETEARCGFMVVSGHLRPRRGPALPICAVTASRWMFRIAVPLPIGKLGVDGAIVPTLLTGV